MYKKIEKIIDGKNPWVKAEFDDLYEKYQQTKDKSLRDRLINSFLPLVISVSRKFYGQGIEPEDLVQEGNIGLIYCFDNRYDPNKAAFSSYATWYIRQAIARSIDDKSRTIRLPTHQEINLRKLNKESENYEKKNGRKPTIEQLAKDSHMPAELVNELLGYSEPSSLDLELGNGDSYQSMYIGDPNSRKRTDFIAQEDLVKMVLDKTTLDPEERELLNERFGLNGNRHHMVLEELGEKYGVTRERVRQRLKNIIKKIKNANASLIKEYEESAKP